MVHDFDRLDVRVRAGGPPRHAVLLCNPKSGGGKVEKFGLVELGHELGVETVMLEPGRDLESSHATPSRGVDCLGWPAVTVRKRWWRRSRSSIGPLRVCQRGDTQPLRTRPRCRPRRPRESMFAFRDAVERRVDYATVNERLFVNNVSLGVYTEIVQQESYRDAKRETTKALLPEMLNRHSEPFDLQFTTRDGEDVDGAIIVMVSNNPYVIGVSADNAERRRLDSGELGVFAVTTRTGSEAARLFAAAAIGQRKRNPFWKEFTATSFTVRSRSGTAFAGVDGEALQMPTPLQFHIHARGLTLLVPAGNLEAAELRRERDVSPGNLLGSLPATSRSAHLSRATRERRLDDRWRSEIECARTSELRRAALRWMCQGIEGAPANSPMAPNARYEQARAVRFVRTYRGVNARPSRPAGRAHAARRPAGQQ